jgi:hypothetical protein
MNSTTSNDVNSNVKYIDLENCKSVILFDQELNKIFKTILPNIGKEFEKDNIIIDDNGISNIDKQLNCARSFVKSLFDEFEVMFENHKTLSAKYNAIVTRSKKIDLSKFDILSEDCILNIYSFLPVNIKIIIKQPALTNLSKKLSTLSNRMLHKIVVNSIEHNVANAINNMRKYLYNTFDKKKEALSDKEFLSDEFVSIQVNTHIYITQLNLEINNTKRGPNKKKYVAFITKTIDLFYNSHLCTETKVVEIMNKYLLKMINVCIYFCNKHALKINS